MSDTEEVRAVTCPSCGARVQIAKGQYRTTCQYCGTLLEFPRPASADMPAGQPGAASPATMETSPGRRNLWLIPLVIALVAAGIGIYMTSGGSSGRGLSQISAALNMQRVSTPALLISGAEGAQRDALVFVNGSDQEPPFLGYIDGSRQILRWQSPPLNQDTSRVSMAEGDKLIYATAGTRVLALNRETGQIAWEASISDELPRRCSHNDCLRALGQRLVILAGDGGLYGLDAQSGRTVWNIRLNSTPDRMVVVNDQIAVFDERDGGVVLSIIHPDDGSEQQTLKPVCSGNSSSATDDAGLNSPLLVDADQRSLYILFGFFHSCAQRWDAAAGELIWNASFEEVSFFSGSSPRSILTDDTLYVASENQVLAINSADGEWRTLIDNPDYEFVPLAAQDGVVILRAKRRRGTARFELWGVDSAAGKQVWRRTLADSEPLDEPDRMSGLIDEGNSAWTAHLTPDGLVVVQVMAQPLQVSVETLDPASGVSGGPMNIPVEGVSSSFYAVPDVVGWTDGALWLIIEGRLNVLDLASNTWALVWP